MRTFRLSIIGLVICAYLSMGASCRGPQDVPILVAESAVASQQIILKLGQSASELEKASILPVASALNVQKRLQGLNESIKKVIPILEAIDRVQQANEPVDLGGLDQALAILQAISPEISLILAGVPVNPTTTALIELVRTAQVSVTTALTEVARLKGQLSRG